MKPSAREAMRRMPEDGKRKLLATHRPTATPVAPLRPSKTGPDSSDVGTLSGLKRFSLASVGWGTGSLDGLGEPLLPSPPTTTYEAAPSTLSIPTPKSPIFSTSLAPSNSVDPPQTPASWTSWWSAASNATGIAQVSEQAKDTPQFYVDQLRSV